MEQLTNESTFIKLKATNWVILIFSSSLFFFSIPTYKIFPEIPSDSPQFGRNLETLDNCISAITSIDFVDYIGLSINYSDYNLLGIYQPLNKYEHKKLLSNSSYEYKYTNNSYEEGYETREITNRYKEIYYFYDTIVKTKKTTFITNTHYDHSTHSCINGYKSCGKVENQNFRLFCVPENSDCPIKKIVNFPTDSYNFNTTQTHYTKKLHDRSYFHYLLYNENDTIQDLHLHLSLDHSIKEELLTMKLPDTPESNNRFGNTSIEFPKFKSQNDITEVYPSLKGYFIYLGTYKINLSEYIEMRCSIQNNYAPPSNSNNSNSSSSSNTNYNYSNNQNNGYNGNNGYNYNPNNINSGSGNNNNGNGIKDVQFSYNDSNLVDYRNKMKNKFDLGLILSMIFNAFCILFIIVEIFIFKTIDFEDTNTTFYVFIILRVFHFIFNFVVFIYEIFLLGKYKFDIAKILFIPYFKVIHGIFLGLCLIILFLDILAFYYLFNLIKVFKELKRKYVGIQHPQPITQNENSSVDKNNNEGNFKINQKESENLVEPRTEESNNVPTTVIKIKSKK